VVERLALIVVTLAADKTGVAPGLDRAGGHAELAGHLAQGEHAGVAEPLLSAAQPVFVADVTDDQGVEGAAFTAAVAAGVEDGSDLGMGVVVQQLVDCFDDVRCGLAQFPGGFGDRQGQAVVLPALPSDVAGDRFRVPGDGDVGEEQAGDALAFSLGSGRVVPDRGEAGDQLADAGFLGIGEIGGGGVLGLVVSVYVPKTSSTLCDQAIFVDQPTDTSLSSDAALTEIDRLG
jgi:hypothetical protein